MSAPDMQAMDLFEHYEESGHLLAVTSSPAGIRLSPGDLIVKRKWGTFEAPAVWNSAAPKARP